MVASGVLVAVRHSEWASPIILVLRKSRSKLRIYEDFKVTVNPYLKQNKYHYPYKAVSADKVASY